MKIQNITLTVGLVIALVAGGAAVAHAGMGGPLFTEARTTLCDNGFLFSQVTIVRPEIHADGWAKCDHPVDGGNPELTHNYYLSLQKRNPSGEWEFVGGAVRTSLVPWSRQTYTAVAPCVAGYWRMYSSVKGMIQGREYGPIETVSKGREVNADECK
ncbi:MULTISPECIES: hypothetical protein [unclassified Nocardia]|uniref:hypothetical protein n=1 Tax=unclassified Nocardia TaxID=2637762 RepID=UPI001CE43DA7|nr:MULTISPECIES: hypothetical protein [unclassified Nocardia]